MVVPKFRAWMPSLQWMCEVTGIVYDLKSIEVCQIGDLARYTEMSVDFKDVILMQSTGLLDENGVEVFEGDIVDFQVPNQELCGIYEVRQAKSGEWRIDNNVQGRSLYIAGSHHCEIIGNIYENPELLEVHSER